MSSLFGRRVVDIMTNKSGGALTKGDVVVIDTANDRAVTTTTTVATTRTVGVVIEENGIASNATGRIQFSGYCALVTPSASVTRGHYGYTHSVAKQAAGRVLRAKGAFCEFLSSSATPDAYLFDTVLPTGSELDYVTFTAGVSITATSEATANTIVTANAITFDGVTAAEIEFYAPSARPRNTTAAGNLFIYLYDGTSVGRMAFYQNVATGTDSKPVLLKHRLVPTAAAHTYSIRAAVDAGTGNIGAGAGGAAADMPGFIRISTV